MNDIKVSVVTACLNVADTIEKTIKSVLDQDYDNLEYIIVDGASDDGTIDIIEKYKDKITKICIEKDDGVYDAMNKGIRMASGELIGFMNAGDRYDEGAVKEIVRAYKDTNADILYGDTIMVFKDRHEYRSNENLDLESYFDENQIFHQSMFVRTALHKKQLFDTQYTLLADYDFFLKQYLSGALFQYVNKNISYYDMNGISATEKIQAAYEARNILIKVIELDSKLNSKYHNKAYNDFLFKMFLIHCEHLPQYSYYINREIKNVTAGHDAVIIFGTGDITRRLIKKIDIDISYYVDNDQEKQGLLLDGIEIFPPNALLNNKEEKKLVFIFSTKYEKEIEGTIKSLADETNIDYMSIYQLGVMMERQLYGMIE